MLVSDLVTNLIKDQQARWAWVSLQGWLVSALALRFYLIMARSESDFPLCESAHGHSSAQADFSSSFLFLQVVEFDACVHNSKGSHVALGERSVD